jgi:hypothetical protein
MRTSSALLALALSLTASLAWGAMTSSPSGIDSRLRLEWEASRSPAGRPMIAGYLYNDYRRAATNVVLLVETLDAAGQVTGRTIGLLPSLVPVSGRTYFTVPLRTGGAGYRLSVTSFEWYAGGSN